MNQAKRQARDNRVDRAIYGRCYRPKPMGSKINKAARNHKIGLHHPRSPVCEVLFGSNV